MNDEDQKDGDSLLAAPPRIVNIGLELFAIDLANQGASVIHVQWSPPAAAHLVELLDKLRTTAYAKKIDAANQEALRRMLAGEPILVDVVPASQAIPDVADRTILHAGPPIGWDRMCGPMRGAVMGIAVFEGWAKDLDDAAKKAAAGAFAFRPNHDSGAVGPMTGLTTGSQPLMVVENKAFGNRGYCAINEGLGKVMRFGGNDAEVLDRLSWTRDVLGPALGRALRELGGVPLRPLIARGLTMGDEMHQRNVACSSLLLRQLAPALARTARNAAELADCLDFIGRNDQFFLNIAMVMERRSQIRRATSRQHPSSPR